MNPPDQSPLRGRLLIIGAAVLWSLSGALVKLITRDTPLGEALGLSEPPVPGLLIAFYRSLFAGLFLVPLLRRADFSFRPLMLVMVLCFASMNALFVSALAMGSAANAIILQYTAPVWMYLASVFLLRESATRRNTVALVIAMSGVGVIVVDALRRPDNETLRSVLVALGSGVTFAAVILCLRVLRSCSSKWLVVLNHLCGALALLPVLWFEPALTWRQLVFMVFFGVVQMGLPYYLMSLGLRSINPQEAGTLSLLEPLLNPVWAYLAAGDVPDTATMIGGVMILAALLWQYAPVNWIRRLDRGPASADDEEAPPDPAAEAS